MEAAERLLRAVADGAPESVALARELVAVVLQDDTVSRAMELDKLLQAKSPLALVRAVALAESVQAGGWPRAAMLGINTVRSPNCVV